MTEKEQILKGLLYDNDHFLGHADNAPIIPPYIELIYGFEVIMQFPVLHPIKK